ncbi:HalOD1 output domain-containing protein [Halomarina rubra]|uniref:HalOD1 output domain-containing protein n=1 Tax=Halomarina rubra TaxID=2071873 RepID=A0ABD6AR31_9EURY|nr:HalOD1 output domain-containing protein [Halomarina rubra]
MTIADTVAAATGRHTDDLPALYDAVAPGALDALFMPRGETRSTPDGWLSFDYAGTHVTVAADDEVSVHVRTDSPVDEETFAANSPAAVADD